MAFPFPSFVFVTFFLFSRKIINDFLFKFKKKKNEEYDFTLR